MDKKGRKIHAALAALPLLFSCAAQTEYEEPTETKDVSPYISCVGNNMITSYGWAPRAYVDVPEELEITGFTATLTANEGYVGYHYQGEHSPVKSFTFDEDYLSVYWYEADQSLSFSFYWMWYDSNENGYDDPVERDYVEIIFSYGDYVAFWAVLELSLNDPENKTYDFEFKSGEYYPPIDWDHQKVSKEYAQEKIEEAKGENASISLTEPAS